MGTINKVFLYNGTPQNGAIAQLWKITAFVRSTDSTADVLDNPLKATSVECNSSDGGVFAVGDVIGMGLEICLIWKISTDKLHIIRGWYGTTPLEHALNTDINDVAIAFPVVDDAVPGAGFQQGGNITTGVAYGGDGAYRFDAVPEMEYYASVTYDAHITYVHCFVERNDITPEQILTVDGDILIRNADTITRLPIGVAGQWLKAGANRPEWDTLTGAATITVTETQVFTGNAPQAWTDLDLSGTIGGNAALVLLKVYCAVLNNYIAFRKDTDTDEFYAVAIQEGAGCAFIRNKSDIHYVVLVAAHTNGFIEWRAQDADATTVDIIAYIKGV